MIMNKKYMEMILKIINRNNNNKILKNYNMIKYKLENNNYKIKK